MARNGYRIFDAMAKLDPDFFLCSGDNIYADGVITATQALPDGSLYRNVTSEAKSHVAVTLDDFRGNFRYNLLDEALRRFNAQVPNVIQWDDHEVRNNWYPGEVIGTGTAYPAGTKLAMSDRLTSAKTMSVAARGPNPCLPSV